MGTSVFTSFRGEDLAPSEAALGRRPGRRLSAHNAAGLWRYARLRTVHRATLHGPLFFLDSRGVIDIGDRADVRVGPRVRFLPDFSGRFYGTVDLGEDVFFGRGCTVSIHDGLRIGDHTGFGEWVSIHDNNHVVADAGIPFREQGFEHSAITIGANVWVGAKATILRGVTIGDGAVVGAHSVVTRDVPAGAIAVGAPARVVGRTRAARSDGGGHVGRYVAAVD